MQISRRLRFSFLVSAIVLLVSMFGSSAYAAAKSTTEMAPIKVVKVAKFGPILATQKNQAIYYWAPEKGGTVKCTGGCAKVWPPVLLAHGMMAPHSIMGVMGTVGVVTRPDGTHQLTFNKWPLYTFTSDTKPLQVLCDGVQGWHVVRVMH